MSKLRRPRPSGEISAEFSDDSAAVTSPLTADGKAKLGRTLKGRVLATSAVIMPSMTVPSTNTDSAQQQKNETRTTSRSIYSLHCLTFANRDEYISTHGPLLVLECWQQIKQAIETLDADSKVYKVKLQSNIQSATDLVDLTARLDKLDNEDVLPKDNFFLANSDLMLLRHETKQILAKVERCRDKGEYYEVILRCNFARDKTGVRAEVAADSTHDWELVPLCNLATINREYTALQQSDEVKLLPNILAGRVDYPKLPTPQEIDDLAQQYRVNSSQARAILCAATTSGFTLIQGPPGTGKTQSILAMIGLLLKRRDERAGAKSKKLLICAPSNAAVDVIVRRLKGGIQTNDGAVTTPTIVRIGTLQNVAEDVRDLHIDKIVNGRLAVLRAQMAEMAEKLDAMSQKLSEVQKAIDNKNDELLLLDDYDLERPTVKLDLRDLNVHKDILLRKLATARKELNMAGAAANAAVVRREVMSSADVICTTLSGAASPALRLVSKDIETIICDEASQATEPSALIPLPFADHCILVGDPMQLPPTVISKDAAGRGYSRSLFARLMETSGPSVHLLRVQYRMHPSISIFPSQRFYGGKVSDAPGMTELRKQAWHESEPLRPYALFNVQGKEKQDEFQSLLNKAEAKVALALYRRLENEHPEQDMTEQVGIISPYKGQVHELRRRFAAALGKARSERITIDTVDSFQGHEKDVIILSCVRGGPEETTIGFLSDKHRMNVALTRAKSSLLILGDFKRLRSNRHWRALIDDAKRREAILQASAIGPLPIETKGSRNRKATKSVKDDKGADTKQTEAEQLEQAIEAISLSRSSTSEAFASSSASSQLDLQSDVLDESCSSSQFYLSTEQSEVDASLAASEDEGGIEQDKGENSQDCPSPNDGDEHDAANTTKSSISSVKTIISALGKATVVLASLSPVRAAAQILPAASSSPKDENSPKSAAMALRKAACMP